MLAAYNLTPPSLNTTRNAIVISADTDLNFKWSKRVGIQNANNQINDIITCEGEDRALMAVGTVSWSTGSKDILLARIDYSSNLEECDISDNINNSNQTATNSPLNLDQINLKSPGCGSYCWVNDETVNIYGEWVSIVNTSTCLDTTSNMQQQMNYITVNQCSSDNCLTNMSFNFTKSPKEVYFELTNITGDYAYIRTFGDTSQLTQGYKFTNVGLTPGEYFWEIEAVYDNEQGMERKFGSITIN